MQLRALWLIAFVGAAGCPATSEDVRPPQDGFYFPTGLALSPDERFLFLNNSNADLRFESGSLQVLDVERIASVVRAWIDDRTVPEGCDADEERRETLVCDESIAILDEQTIRIGNFAGELRSQALDDGGLRLFMPVRGDPSLTWVDFDAATQTLDCGGSGSYPRCDEAHRLTRLRNDPEQLPLSTEPFGIYVDPAGYVMMTHLSTGNVTLASAPTDGAPPVLADVKGGFFDVNRVTGIRGAVGVAGRSPGSPANVIYLTSRSESRVQTVYVATPSSGSLPTIVPSDYFFLNTVFPAEDSRSIAFNAAGTRAHVINRRPPSLITVDTSPGPSGRPLNEVRNATELCAEASIAEVLDPGLGERVYVSCFRDGQIWVIDGDVASLEAVVLVGRGPFAITASEANKLLFVTNVLEDTVAVIDLAPGARTENRVVLRLGTPSFNEDND